MKISKGDGFNVIHYKTDDGFYELLGHSDESRHFSLEAALIASRLLYPNEYTLFTMTVIKNILTNH